MLLLQNTWLCSAASEQEDESSSDDAVSVLTHPSLPSLQSLIPPIASSSASFLCLSSLSAPSSGGGAASLAASSVLLYSVSEFALSVYALSDLRPLETLPAPPRAGAVKSASLSPDGSSLFTAHQDGRIRVWSRSPSSGLHRLAASLPTTSDRLLRLPLPRNYVAVRRHHKRLWIEHVDAVSGVVAHASGRVYSVSWDKTLKVWSAAGLRCAESVAAHEDAVNAVAVAPDGTIYTGSADRRIRVWRDGEGGRHGLVATLNRHRSAVNALALSDDSTVLYSGACDRSVLVWERDGGPGWMRVAGTLRGHKRAILSLACKRDIVVSGSGDGVVRVWRKEGMGYGCVATMEGHTSGVRSLVAVMMPTAFCEAEEYRVCSGSLDGEVRVWKVCISSL